MAREMTSESIVADGGAIMGKQTTQQTIHKFYKRKLDNTNDKSCSTSQNQASKRSKASTNESGQHQNHLDPHTSETPRQNNEEFDLNSLERDPGKRKQIWSYPVNKREQVRRAYINLGPFQIHLKEYPAKGSTKHPRKFRYSWFSIFPNWLEYSPTIHSAYCFLCYLFSDKPSERQRSDVFVVEGFDKWKKVNDGKRCAFLKHIGSSKHKNALAFSENLINQETHIDNILEKLSKEKIYNNRLRLKASVDVIRWLTFQATLDKQLHELNYIFNDHALELLSISSALVPKKESEGFDIDQICLLVEKCYSADFTEQERVRLKYKLELLNIAMKENLQLSQVSTLVGLHISLVKTGKYMCLSIF
ncbi:Zinc finger MYM-type protein 1 [Artemisia annua]|uniref:Zinc finger MYM-type protein 1 n=1 Tax=Artemisia annua TaxID=35608 RepID=A0A2U1NTH9_ARTAN|nr:Zinc finger MYM-type protein 1 [Artemisia annua]